MSKNKIRVWDNKNKKYLDELDYFVDFNGNVFKKQFYEMPPEEDVVVERYTCIEENNGVEVCEGDLFTRSDVKSNVFSVEFYNGAFWGIPEKGYGHSQPLSYFTDYLKVVGNIHENTDLLK